jgi:DNA-binding NtrC family response regulator
MATPGLSVWVVDDDESVRWVLEQALKQAQMIPRSFDAGRTFFAALERDRPDVIVTDIRMPDMSGLELMERLGRTNPDIPVIAARSSICRSRSTSTRRSSSCRAPRASARAEPRNARRRKRLHG